MTMLGCRSGWRCSAIGGGMGLFGVLLSAR
jgi:hypothetical protein